MLPFISLFILFIGMVIAAPTNTTNGDQPTILVKNHCNATLKVGYSKDVDYFGTVVDVSAGSSYTIHPSVGWSGRVWGRKSCSGDKCYDSGMGSPASLAEFHFLDSGNTFYDISFVDGFNLPMVVEPASKSKEGDTDGRMCSTPRCTTLPECPSGWETYDDNGNFSGCKSACTKFNTDEYCCTGAYNGQNLCHENQYTEQVKDVCPDVYSYAYDDATSVFTCGTRSFTVTIC